jgi:hypothetical protein
MPLRLNIATRMLISQISMLESCHLACHHPTAKASKDSPRTPHTTLNGNAQDLVSTLGLLRVDEAGFLGQRDHHAACLSFPLSDS